MTKLLLKLERCPKPILILASLLFVGLVGGVDYLSGFEVFFSVFYLLGVGAATWFISTSFGRFISVLSVLIWILGDVRAGARYSNSIVPVWNATILLVFYLIVVALLARLKASHTELENRVRQRTQALTHEITERQRLEMELIDVSEREQRRIGHDLHDSLCQHLTGTALAGQVLKQKLVGRGQPEAADAGRVVELVEEGITMARDLARGLYSVEMQADGLMSALDELAANTTKWFKVQCQFQCPKPVLIHDSNTAIHLCRIAQEAVSNAVRHGNPSSILLSLAEASGNITLSIEDDGTGLADDWQKGPGIGTRIMAHRAAIIGAAFSVDPNPLGGTLVQCAVPLTTP